MQSMEITLIQVHLMILTITFFVILYADHLGFNWMRGKEEVLDQTVMKRLHRAVWLGLLGMISTGFLMAWPGREYYLSHTPFIIKICFVAVLVGNALVIGKISDVAYRQRFASLSQKQKIGLLISGGVSTACWVGAFLTAKFFL